MKRKICVVITARPSYSRIRSTLKAIHSHPELELQLVVAASALLERYGDISNIIEKDGFQITARVYMVLEGENLTSMPKTTGLGLMELSSIFDGLRPDMLVSVADRYETIATAIAGAYMNIPVVHVQGGEITGSIDEKVRHAVTKLADYHFVATRMAASNVIGMGEYSDRVHVTGCPSIDLAEEVLQQQRLDFDPFSKYGGLGNVFDISQGYLVVMQHPVTTECDSARQQIVETLYAMAELNVPTLWFWPNVDAGSDGVSKGIRCFRESVYPDNMHFFRNMEPIDFLRLLINSKGLVGNSSVGIRECSYLGVPVVNIGSRQKGRERGVNVIDVEYDREAIKKATKKQMKKDRYISSTLYGDGKAGIRMANLLAELSPVTEKKLSYL